MAELVGADILKVIGTGDAAAVVAAGVGGVAPFVRFIKDGVGFDQLVWQVPNVSDG